MTAARTVDVLGVGYAALDLVCLVERFPEPDTKSPVLAMSRQGGGQVGTALAAVARLGGRAAFIGRFGDDEEGTLARAALEGEGVDCSRALVVPGMASVFSVVIVEAASGRRTVLSRRDPRVTLEPGDVPREAVAAARAVHLATHEVAGATAAARHARLTGTLVSLDAERVRPGVAELVPLVDYLVASHDFPRAFTGRTDDRTALEALADLGPPVVVQTLAERGARAFVGGCHLEAAGFEVPVVDTTGAGDVFHGAFLLALLERDAGRAPAPALVAEAMRVANAAAALKCSHLGGREGIPRRADLDRFLAERGRSATHPDDAS